MKKLLIVGSNTIHIYNYIDLIKDYFDDILLLTDKKNEKYNVESIEIDFSLGFNIFNSIKKVKKIFNKYKPSIIHIHQANSYAFIVLLALKNIKTPKILTAWGSDILINPKQSFILKKVLEFNLNNINIATSDSLYMANEIQKYNENLDIKIVNFGIITNDKMLKKENIIYSNRLHKKLYNIDKIIYAFYKFRKNNNDDWKLIIGGNGKETKNLKKLVKELNIEEKVEFIGWVDSKTNNKYYQKAKIYISIPSSDATSISLLEAISNNCVCFVSNLPANCEHILDGINGFIETNLDNINLEKYKNIDVNVQKQVNSIRKKEYLKETNKNKFINIYDNLLKGK